MKNKIKKKIKSIKKNKNKKELKKKKKKKIKNQKGQNEGRKEDAMKKREEQEGEKEEEERELELGGGALIGPSQRCGGPGCDWSIVAARNGVGPTESLRAVFLPGTVPGTVKRYTGRIGDTAVYEVLILPLLAIPE